MKRYLFPTITFLVISLTSCKKEDERLNVNLDQLCQNWTLKEMNYTHDAQKSYTYIPQKATKLNLIKGGRYEILDTNYIMNMEPFYNSIADQWQYGLWEFTNESKANQLVFNKGISIYDPYSENSKNYNYKFNNAEYVLDFEVTDNTLTFSTTDYSLIYMYAFYCAMEDAKKANIDTNLITDNAALGDADGAYYGYAHGYRDGALQAYDEANEDIDIYRVDPYYNGQADGRKDFFQSNYFGSLDMTTYPNYKNSYDPAFDAEYNAAFSKAYTNATSLEGPGKLTLTFIKK